MESGFKFVFFGTPKFAAIILENLIKAGFSPQAVVCNPDKPAGRKKIITPPPTKVSAQKYNIPVLQPEILTDCKLQITNYKPDFFIVAAYAKIIPGEILKIPRLGAVGVHPSLLPKYRGPSPIQTTILESEGETGVTLFLMDEKVDHGPILAQQKLEFSISDFQFLKLHDALGELSADLLIEALPKFIKGEITPQIQDENRATYTKKFKTEDVFTQFADLKKAMEEGGETAAIIERKIRALNPEPGVFTFVEKNSRLLRIKILDAVLKEGKIVLTKIQPEGKKIIDDLNLIKQYVE